MGVSQADLSGLSPRQRLVLQMALADVPTGRIALDLHYSVATIKKDLRKIYRHLAPDEAAALDALRRMRRNR